jgi:hypothetical protein
MLIDHGRIVFDGAPSDTADAYLNLLTGSRHESGEGSVAQARSSASVE